MNDIEKDFVKRYVVISGVFLTMYLSLSYLLFIHTYLYVLFSILVTSSTVIIVLFGVYLYLILKESERWREKIERMVR